MRTVRGHTLMVRFWGFQQVYLRPKQGWYVGQGMRGEIMSPAAQLLLHARIFTVLGFNRRATIASTCSHQRHHQCHTCVYLS